MSNLNFAVLSVGMLLGLIASQHYDMGLMTCMLLAFIAIARAIFCEGQRAKLAEENREWYDAQTPTIPRIEWPGGDRESTRRLIVSHDDAKIVPPVLEEPTVVEFRSLRPITGETPTLPM